MKAVIIILLILSGLFLIWDCYGQTKKPNTYEVIESSSKDRLEELVSSALGCGAKTCGGISVIHECGSRYYAQAIQW